MFNRTQSSSPKPQLPVPLKLAGAKRREFSGMIQSITPNNNPSNPHSEIHSLNAPDPSHGHGLDHLQILLGVGLAILHTGGRHKIHRRDLPRFPRQDAAEAADAGAQPGDRREARANGWNGGTLGNERGLCMAHV